MRDNESKTERSRAVNEWMLEELNEYFGFIPSITDVLNLNIRLINKSTKQLYYYSLEIDQKEICKPLIY